MLNLLTIKKTQEALINKKIKCSELVDNYYRKIEKSNTEINSYITLTQEKAFEKAKKLDNLLLNEKENVLKTHPLFGVCISFKDNYLTKGIRTTAGSQVLENYIPQYSATVVERLLNAGAIMIGKTNCDAWAHGSSGENSDFGLTRNPWNRQYVPGGSSSGSGACLGADFSLIATGTDTCGSIRLPSNYCYTYGLKPTYGSVSRYGIVAMASSLDTVGHFARCIEDIEKVFLVTKGIDYSDATLKEVTHGQEKSKLTIGIPKEFFGDGLDKEVKENIFKAIEVWKENGINIKEVELPHTKYAVSVYYIIQPAEVSSNLARYDGIRFGEKREVFGDEAIRRIMLGTYVLSSGYFDAYYLKAMKVRSIIIKEVDRVFEKVDVLIAPVAPTPPFKLGEKISDPLKMYLTDIYAATANLTGIPSLAVPFNFSKIGLPLGFQIMSPRFCEDRLFSLAKLFEKITNYKEKVANL